MYKIKWKKNTFFPSKIKRFLVFCFSQNCVVFSFLQNFEFFLRYPKLRGFVSSPQNYEVYVPQEQFENSNSHLFWRFIYYLVVNFNLFFFTFHSPPAISFVASSSFSLGSSFFGLFFSPSTSNASPSVGGGAGAANMSRTSARIRCFATTAWMRSTTRLYASGPSNKQNKWFSIN